MKKDVCINYAINHGYSRYFGQEGMNLLNSIYLITFVLVAILFIFVVIKNE